MDSKNSKIDDTIENLMMYEGLWIDVQFYLMDKFFHWKLLIKIKDFADVIWIYLFLFIYFIIKKFDLNFFFRTNKIITHKSFEKIDNKWKLNYVFFITHNQRNKISRWVGNKIFENLIQFRKLKQ